MQSASASQALKTAGAVGLGIGFVGITASASDDHTPAQNNPWDHGTLFGSYDHARYLPTHLLLSFHIFFIFTFGTIFSNTLKSSRKLV